MLPVNVNKLVRNYLIDVRDCDNDFGDVLYAFGKWEFAFCSALVLYV